MKIICIEDSGADLYLIEHELKKIFPDAEIFSFHYFHDFLNAKVEHDLVITDLAMPDMYGPKIIKKIREVSDKPIIVFSGVGGKKTVQEISNNLKESGADLFLSKNEDGYALLARSLNQFL